MSCVPFLIPESAGKEGGRLVGKLVSKLIEVKIQQEISKNIELYKQNECVTLSVNSLKGESLSVDVRFHS